jgi:two-component system chemotaxis response regulator CheY
MSGKILIVDDSRTIRQQVGTALIQAGYQIVEAEDGLEGLTAIGAQSDLVMVICDINMPNMDGIEMLTAMKADEKNAGLPVVMLTTEGKAELIQRAKRIGAKGWMVKPFKPEQLIAVVRKIVGH